MDKIDEKDKLTASKRTVVKSWNVMYNMPIEDAVDEPEPEPEPEPKSSPPERNSLGGNEFNAATGSNSGAYGRGGVSEENKDQVNSILAQHDLDLSGIFEDMGNSSAEDDDFDDTPTGDDSDFDEDEYPNEDPDETREADDPEELDDPAG